VQPPRRRPLRETLASPEAQRRSLAREVVPAYSRRNLNARLLPPEEHGGRTLEGVGREEYFRRTLDAAQEAFISIDAAGLITAWNPQAEATFGWSESEVVGRTIASTIIPPSYRESHQQGLARFLETGEGPMLNKRLELPALRRDGSEFLVELTISAIRVGGEYVFNAFLHDITERKRLEREITRFMELSLDLLAIGDLEGNFRRTNRAFEAMLGYSELELVGQSYIELFHPEDRASVVDELERMRAGDGETRDFEGRIRCKDGSYRSILWSAKISPDEELIYAVGKDITERKRTEQAIREIEVLERSNLELEQFAYDASHDLGEPLRMMSLLAGRLGRMYGDRLDEEGQRLIASIVDGSERMQILISDLLAYSRAARDPLERTLVDCSAVLKDTLALLQESIAEKDAHVTFDPMPTLVAEPVQLKEVFQNLLSNALKFTDELSLRVHVGAERETDAWHFWVRDNGIGIDPQQAERVFEMFRRIHPRDAYAGSGLGLSICKRIVERHGGRIWVEPARVKGSIFHFTIPGEPPRASQVSS
jgi:PAS domain S-box-containing protein